MSEHERRRWNRRYREGSATPRQHPSPFLLDSISVIDSLGALSGSGPSGRGRALDVACGTGRNALALAAAGFEVTAIDVSEVALEAGAAAAADRHLELDWIQADLDEWTPEPDAFALITVLRYRNPALWPRLCDALAVDGWLMIEHHLRTSLEVAGPTSADFRLEPQELLRATTNLRVIRYAEAVEVDEEYRDERGALRRTAVARVLACAGDPGF